MIPTSAGEPFYSGSENTFISSRNNDNSSSPIALNSMHTMTSTNSREKVTLKRKADQQGHEQKKTSGCIFNSYDCAHQNNEIHTNHDTSHRYLTATTNIGNNSKSCETPLASCESTSLRCVKFTSFPCRPQLSMQRNAKFDTITELNQTLNRVRFAGNMFLKAEPKEFNSC